MNKLIRLVGGAVASLLLLPAAATAADSFRGTDQSNDVRVNSSSSAPTGFESRRDSYDIRGFTLGRTGDTIRATFEMGGPWPADPGSFNGFELRLQTSVDDTTNEATWVFRRESREAMGEVVAIRMTDGSFRTDDDGFCTDATYEINTTTLSLLVPADCVDWAGPVYAAWHTFEFFDGDMRNGANDFAPNVEMAGPIELDTVGGNGSDRDRPTPTARVYTDTCDGEQDHTFDDAKGTTHDYSIRCVSGYGITKGKGDGTFDPGGTLSHGQTASFLRAALAAGGRPVSDATSDLCNGSAGVHETNIEALAQAGIIESSACSKASTPIDRARMAVWTSQALSHAKVTDVDNTTDWYWDDEDIAEESHINRITAYGVVTGKGGGAYGPRDTLLRGQMATFLARTLDTVLDNG